MPGQIFVVSGPSGVGKSTIIKILREKTSRLGYSVSHTTRKPRGREKNGINYHFIDKPEFKQMIGEKAFVEWAEVYDEFYGTSFSSLKGRTDSGLDVIMDIDFIGAKNIKKHLPDSILIYILPPSIETLKARLQKRATESVNAMSHRLEKALNEIKHCTFYEYLIFNDDLKNAVTEITAIIKSERCKKKHRLSLAERAFNISLPDRS